MPLAWRARPLALPVRYVLAGLGFLLATIALGLAMAVMFACPAASPWGYLLDRGCMDTGGILGWFTLTALGVSHRLLAMFILAPDDRGVLGDTAFIATSAGLALFLLNMSRLYRARRRPRLEPHVVTAAVSFFALAMAMLLLLGCELGLGLGDRLVGPALYLLLFGWLIGLGLANSTSW